MINLYRNFLLATAFTTSTSTVQTAPPTQAALQAPVTATCQTQRTGAETFPAWNPGSTYASTIAQATSNYQSQQQDWRFYKVPNGYVANGPYVTFSGFATLGSDSRFDNNGVVEGLYNGEWHYNPVTLAQYSLYHHTRYVRDGIPLPSAYWATIGKLQQMVGPDGALRYTFAFDGQQPGWVSAMAQGQVLSAFSRAYLLSGDPSLVEQGNRILNFMLTPVAQGGTRGNLADLHPSLSNYLSLYEYDYQVSPHTLNGFMFTLFGLYDWWGLSIQAPNAGANTNLAHAYFDCGVHTVVSTLPYYDIGGFSAYDMRQALGMGGPSVSPVYHKFHIALLWGLYAVTGKQELITWANQWGTAVNQPATP